METQINTSKTGEEIMKRSLQLIILFTILTGTVFAQVINTQGILRDANNRAVPDGTYEITFRIYDAESGGTVLWTSPANTTVEVVNGVYTTALEVGSSLGTTGDQNSTGLWLSLQIGTDIEMEPRLRLHLNTIDQMQVAAGTNSIPSSGNVTIGGGSDDDKQLFLEGTSNTGANLGSATGTYKLFISKYNNDDGKVVYPFYVQDENALVDFWLKNRASASASPTAYFAGRVGIGNTSPGEELVIYTNGSAYAQFINDSTGTTSSDGFEIGAYSSGSGKIWNFENKDIYFGTNNSEKLRITANGNVGIGTPNPDAQLHISSTNNEEGILLSGAGSSDNGGGRIFFKEYAASGTGNGYGFSVAYSGANNANGIGLPGNTFAIKNHYNSDSGDVALAISRNSGNVGIGTGTPSNPLTVSGNANFTGDVGIGTASPTRPLHVMTDPVGDGSWSYGFKMQLPANSAAGADNWLHGIRNESSDEDYMIYNASSGGGGWLVINYNDGQTSSGSDRR